MEHEDRRTGPCKRVGSQAVSPRIFVGAHFAPSLRSHGEAALARRVRPEAQAIPGACCRATAPTAREVLARLSSGIVRREAWHDCCNLGRAGHEGACHRMLALPTDVQRDYERRAGLGRDKKRDEVNEDVAHIKADVGLKRRRAEEEKAIAGDQLKAAARKYSERQVAALQRLWQSDGFVSGEVDKLRALSMKPPERPPEIARESLESHIVGAAIMKGDKGDSASGWVKAMASHREYFLHIAIVVVGPESRKYYWF